MKLSFHDIRSWSIAGPKGGAYHGKLPNRMKLVHPSVTKSLRSALNASRWLLEISDLYRDPIASLEARRRKGSIVGVQRPGYSGHNYGISMDIYVEGTLWAFVEANKTRSLAGSDRLPETYTDLLAWLGGFGWTCHRFDGKRGSEDWHFNCLGYGLSPPRGSVGPQRWINNHYEDQFSLDETEVQRLLSKIGLYKGEIDGQFGPLSRAALRAFECAYDLPSDGHLDEMTCRTLALVTADLDLVVLDHNQADHLLGLPPSP